MCRQCLVEIDTGRGAMLQPCVHDHRRARHEGRTESPTAKRAQEGILELLLANHPLDCPVCDKGGECPLQDQAFTHGPGESRYVEEKRHYEKPIPISDLVLLDRERCILCDRCTRFADEVAGDKLIHFINRGNDTQVDTFPDEPFASYFSGNAVQICPVGALTAKPYRFKARPWDLEQAEATCTTCSVGCRISVQSSRDQIVRHQGVDTERSVNWGWLCDRGRFNFEAVDMPAPARRAARAHASRDIGRPRGRPRCGIAVQADPVGGFDRPARRGPRTNEEAYAWAQLADALGHPAPRRPARRRTAGGRARPAPRHDRRGRHGGHRRAARTRPEGGAPRAVPAVAGSGGAAQGPHHRARRPRHRHDEARLAHDRHLPGGAPAEVAKAFADHVIAEQLGAGRRRRRRRARATSPSPRPRPSPRCRRCSPRSRALGCSLRSGAATSSVRSSSGWHPPTPTTTRSPHSAPRPTASSTCSCCSAPTR